MQDYTVDETKLAVKVFEKVMAQANRTVKHYHADNGAFAHKGFLDEVNRKDQKITFCTIGAHYQNGIIETKIRCSLWRPKLFSSTAFECGSR
jgi:hypothetical protein